MLMTSTKSETVEIRFLLNEMDMHSLMMFEQNFPKEYIHIKARTINERRQKMEEGIQLEVDKFKKAYGHLGPVKVIAKRFTEKESIEHNGLNLGWRPSHLLPSIELHCEWQFTYEDTIR
jgi:hypothetical protein